MGCEMDGNKAERLFAGWDEVLIWSCLQGYLGKMSVDNEENPAAAVIDAGDFCFFAGTPNSTLFDNIHGSKLLIPRDKPWETLIEGHYGGRVKRFLRYAIKKEPDVFNRERLHAFVEGLGAEYEVRLFDRDIFALARSEAWSFDLCAQFEDWAEYENKGAVGAAILHGGRLVAGAGTYAVYRGGIEIEIDTRRDYRRRGLATVCGARLILECLDRGLYPSWDAHDLRSVALAEKLGYHLDKAYTAYALSGELEGSEKAYFNTNHVQGHI